MINMSLIFAMMMLPGVAVLVASFVVRIFEASPRELSRTLADKLSQKDSNCWKVEV